MPEQRTKKKAATNTRATGGFGFDYEAEAGAHYLALLLQDNRAPGHPDNSTVCEVGFQQRSAALDDIVVTSRTAERSCAEQISVKSRLAPTKGDKEFREFMARSWEGSRLNSTTLFGLLAPPSLGLDDFASLLTAASTHATSAGMLTATRGTREAKTYSTVKSILALTVPGVSDNDTHQFLRRMRFHPYALSDTRDDAADVQHLRRLCTEATDAAARRLLADLTAIARELRVAGASITRVDLWKRLRATTQVALALPVDLHRIAGRLNVYAAKAQLGVRGDVNGQHVDRTAAVDAVLSNTSSTLILGAGGVGKTAILQEVDARLRAGGPTLYLSADLINENGTWGQLTRDMGFDEAIAVDTIIESLAFNSDAAYVLFDGLDRIESAVRPLVLDIVRACERYGTRVVATLRDSNVQHLASWLTFSSLAQFTVGRLSSSEVRELAKNVTHLAALLNPAHLNDVTANPMILRLISDERVQSADLSASDASENDAFQAWWDGVIRSADRRQALLIFAERARARLGQWVDGDGIDGVVIDGLLGDGILIRNDADRYRFAHDILAEWCIAFAMYREIDDSPTPSGDGTGLGRAFRLAMERVLEHNDTERYWEILSALANGQDLRWYYAAVDAPLASAKASQVLDALEVRLLGNEQTHLTAMLRRLHTVHVLPNPIILRNTESGLPLRILVEAAYADLLPDYGLWIGALSFFIGHERALSQSARLALLEVGNIWLRASEPGWRFRLDFFEVAQRLLPGLGYRSRLSLTELAYGDADRAEHLCHRIILLCAAEQSEAAASLLQALGDKHSGEGADKVLADQLVLERLAARIPSALSDFIFNVSVDSDDYPPYAMNFAEQNYGFETHVFDPPHDRHAALAALFRQAEEQALALVRRMCEHGMQYWERSIRHPRFQDGLTPVPFTVRIFGETFEFFGDKDCYVWFRPTSAGPHPLLSALCTLETWLLEQIDAGQDAAKLIRRVFAGNRCCALLGIVIGLLYDRFDRLCNVLFPIAANGHVSRLEEGRMGLEIQGDLVIDMIGMMHSAVAKHLRERDAKRQRIATPRDVARGFLFHPAVERACRDEYLGLIKNLTPAVLYAEESRDKSAQDALLDDVKRLQAFANPDNYSPQALNGIFTFPKELHAPLPPPNEDDIEHELFAFIMLPVATRSTRVSAARELAQKLPLESPVNGHLSRATRMRLMSAAATLESGVTAEPAILTQAASDVTEGLRYMDVSHWMIDGREGQPYTATAMAKGLARLLESNGGDAALQEHARNLARSKSTDVVIEFLREAASIWDASPEFMEGVVATALTVKRAPALKSKFAANVSYRNYEKEAHLLACIPDSVISENHSANGFYRRKLDSLIKEARKKQDRSSRRAKEFHWEDTLAALCLRDIMLSEGIRARRLTKLLCDWEAWPWTYAYALHTLVNWFTRADLRPAHLELWDKLTQAFLTRLPADILSLAHPREPLDRILRHMVFVQSVIPAMVPENWPMVGSFVPFFRRYASSVGASPVALESLMFTLLNQSGVLEPTETVDIVLRARANITKLNLSLGKNGAYYAARVLERAWVRGSTAIVKNREVVSKLSQFCAELSTTEVIAAKLYQDVEETSKLIRAQKRQ